MKSKTRVHNERQPLLGHKMMPRSKLNKGKLCVYRIAYPNVPKIVKLGVHGILENMKGTRKVTMNEAKLITTICRVNRCTKTLPIPNLICSRKRLVSQTVGKDEQIEWRGM